MFTYISPFFWLFPIAVVALLVLSATAWLYFRKLQALGIFAVLCALLALLPLWTNKAATVDKSAVDRALTDLELAAKPCGVNRLAPKARATLTQALLERGEHEVRVQKVVLSFTVADAMTVEKCSN